MGVSAAIGGLGPGNDNRSARKATRATMTKNTMQRGQLRQRSLGDEGDHGKEH